MAFGQFVAFSNSCCYKLQCWRFFLCLHDEICLKMVHFFSGPSRLLGCDSTLLFFCRRLSSILFFHASRCQVAATLIAVVLSLLVLLLLPDTSLNPTVLSPVLSALLSVDVTVSPLPTFTWQTGLATVALAATSRVSITLSCIDCCLTLWYKVMSHVSSCAKPTSFIACLILMAPLAAAMMPAAQDNSSSTLSVASDMVNEECCTVLAHFYPWIDDTGLVCTPSFVLRHRKKYCGHCSKCYFDD